MHGCFWHRHADCALARLPKSKLDFWKTKLDANRVRDENQYRRLVDLGWRVLVIWECEMKDEAQVARRVRGFLADNRETGRDEVG